MKNRVISRPLFQRVLFWEKGSGCRNDSPIEVFVWN